MLTAALLTTVKVWKQPRCPQQMNGLRRCGTYTMEYHSAIKNKIMLFAGKWMEMEIITLSEASQKSERQRSHVFPLWGR
jgi:hypothetical protein